MTPGSDAGPIRVLIAMYDLAEGERIRQEVSRTRNAHVEVMKVYDNGSACEVDAYFQPHPDVIIAEDMLPGKGGKELAKTLRTKLPWISVIVLARSDNTPRPGGASTVDQAVTEAMLAGAAGCLPKPSTEQEYENLRDVVVRAGRAAHERQNELGKQNVAHGACVVAVYGPKGGIGRTVIAAKLAYLLAEPQVAPAPRVALCELGVPISDLTPLLDANPQQTVRDLIQKGSISISNLKTVMYPLPRRDNLHVLFAPRWETEKGKLTEAHVSSIVYTLRPEFEYVVIDTSAGYSAVTQQALRSADVHVLITTPDLLGFEDTKHVYRMVRPMEKATYVVINRNDKKLPYKEDEMIKYITTADNRRAAISKPYVIDEQHEGMHYALDSGELLGLMDKRQLDFTRVMLDLSSAIRADWEQSRRVQNASRAG